MKKLIILSVSLLAIHSVVYAEGRGTQENPYLIKDLDDLIAMRKILEKFVTKSPKLPEIKLREIRDLKKHDSKAAFLMECELRRKTYSEHVYFKLTNDIDASLTADPNSKYWNSGRGFIPFPYFYGTFDGDGHVIKNLYIHVPRKDDCKDIKEIVHNSNSAALFAYNSGTIKNLGLDNCNINGYFRAAGIVSVNEGGLISHCYTTGRIRLTLTNDKYFRNSMEHGFVLLAGICGLNRWGHIEHCYSSAFLNANCRTAMYVGGLVAESHSCDYANHVALGKSFSLCRIDISNVKSCFAGGIVGLFTALSGSSTENYLLSSSLSKCFSMTTISGHGQLANVCAHAQDDLRENRDKKSNSLNISESYSKGSITAGDASNKSRASSVGGFICEFGDNKKDAIIGEPIRDCYSADKITKERSCYGAGGFSHSLEFAGSKPAIFNCYSITKIRDLTDPKNSDRKSYLCYPFVEFATPEDGQFGQGILWQCDEYEYNKYFKYPVPSNPSRFSDPGSIQSNKRKYHNKNGTPLKYKDMISRKAYEGWDFDMTWYKHDGLPELRRVVMPGPLFMRFAKSDDNQD